MASVTVSINGRRYEIACDDGQEAHLTRLSRYVDQRVKELAAAVGQIGDSRLLVMTSLLIADELTDVRSELDNAGKAESQAQRHLSDEIFAETLEKITERIEAIAETLEES